MQKSASRSFRSLWIILFDHSSSMADSFSGSAELAGHAKTGEYATKIEAAKDITLSELEKFGQLFDETQEVDVAVIAFTSQSELLFKCPANQSHHYRHQIEKLSPTNGTSIDTALTFANQNILSWDKGDRYRTIHILVVSDGLSDVDQAQQAAWILGENGVSINVMLIDPSPDGIKLAKAIKFGGDVTPVYSKAELKSALEKEAKSLTREIKGKLTLTQILVAVILPIIVALITIISMSFGVASQITPERKIFQSTILFGIPLILLGGYFLYLWYERIGEHEIYINRHEKKSVPRYKRSKKQRRMFLIIGILTILLGVAIITWGSVRAPDSPFVPTSTPTITPTATFTPSPTSTSTLTTTPKPTASRTMTPTKTLTQTVTP